MMYVSRSELLISVCGSIFLLMATTGQSLAQVPESPDRDSAYRTEVIEPFHIIDNVYYVGTTLHNSSYLFTSSEGHILMDTTWEEMVPGIVANIEKLGFDIEDIKFILSTHAHHDHVGGHAEMKEMTGATILATAPDAEVIETGGEADFRYGDPATLYWNPSQVDQIIEDGEQIRLGDIVLTAHLTPGHTKGCTTWTTSVEDNGQEYDLLLMCGLRMDPRGPLVGNPKYLEMPQEFAYSFAIMKTLPVEVFLGAHGYWFNLGEKLQQLKAGAEVNPFIDPDMYYRVVDGWEREYIERLKIER